MNTSNYNNEYIDCVFGTTSNTQSLGELIFSGTLSEETISAIARDSIMEN